MTNTERETSVRDQDATPQSELIVSRPRDEQRVTHAGSPSVDERLEQKIGFTKHCGPVYTAFGDHDYIFYHDGQTLRCYTDSDRNPGWIYEDDEAVSCLRHQLRMGRDYRSEHASVHRAIDVEDETNG